MSHAALGQIPKRTIGGIAVTCLIIGISAYVPVFGFFCVLLLPLALVFYRLKLGRINAAVVLTATAVIMGVNFGEISMDLLFFCGLMLIGFTLAECLEQNLSVEKTILYPSATVISAGILGLAAYSHSLETGVVALVSEYVAKNLSMTLALYEKVGMPKEDLKMITDSLQQIEFVLVRILPAGLVALTLLITWTSLLLARSVMKRKELAVPDFGALNQWRSPEMLVWAVIACALGILLVGKTMGLLAVNGLIILMIIYFFQGIAIVSFYFEKKKLPRMLKVFLYSIIAIQQLFLLMVVGLGFFDVWLNFRRLGKENAG